MAIKKECVTIKQERQSKSVIMSFKSFERSSWLKNMLWKRVETDGGGGVFSV